MFYDRHNASIENGSTTGNDGIGNRMQTAWNAGPAAGRGKVAVLRQDGLQDMPLDVICEVY